MTFHPSISNKASTSQVKWMPVAAYNLSYGGDVCIWYLKAPAGKERTAEKSELFRNPHIGFTSHFDYCNFVDFLNHYLFSCRATESTAISHCSRGNSFNYLN